MKHIVAVGVCYLDTILSVPHFPEEDSKLRATSSQVRRGGNCGNTLEVLQQLLHSQEANNGGNNSTSKTGAAHTQLHLLSPLPDASSPAAAQILGSFGSGGGGGSTVGSELCLHRAGMTLPASSYIIRSESTGSRTIVSQVPLAEMTKDEFAGAVAAFAAASNSDETAQDQSWWHFEGRIPETTLLCIRHLRRVLPSATVSVEVEKPGREGLQELAAEADVVFYSKSWAESRGYRGPEQCLRGEAPSSHASRLFVTWGAEGASAFSTHGRDYHRCAVKDVAAGNYRVVDTIGAGDTFIAGVIFGLFCRDGDEGRDLQDTLRFAVGLATRKVQIDGFGGLGGGRAGCE